MIAESRCLGRVAAIALSLCALAGCGKKGPPLAPLRFVPGPATELKVLRSGDDVRVQFVLPAANVQGQGPIDLERIEVYAVTVGPDAVSPPNRDLLVRKFLVGTVLVKPPAKAGSAPSATEDTRPAPGAPATFEEALSPATLSPQITTAQAPPAPPGTAEAGAAAAAAVAAAASQEPPVLRRIYALRGVSRGGRPGQPSTRVVLPLVDAPAPPANATAAFTETAVTLTWAPPPAATSAGGTPSVNIYAADGANPINPAPLTGTSFDRPGVTLGTEECFVLRTVLTRGAATIESAPTAPVCVTPVDRFAPAAPTGLAAVGAAGAVNLIWDPNTESDLAGYLVLRGEAPGDTLQAITTAPIRETTFRDTTATPGVRYVYAVVAVDRATPPNVSAQSGRVEETAR